MGRGRQFPDDCHDGPVSVKPGLRAVPGDAEVIESVPHGAAPGPRRPGGQEAMVQRADVDEEAVGLSRLKRTCHTFAQLESEPRKVGGCLKGWLDAGVPGAAAAAGAASEGRVSGA